MYIRRCLNRCTHHIYDTYKCRFSCTCIQTHAYMLWMHPYSIPYLQSYIFAYCTNMVLLTAWMEYFQKIHSQWQLHKTLLFGVEERKRRGKGKEEWRRVKYTWENRTKQYKQPKEKVQDMHQWNWLENRPNLMSLCILMKIKGLSYTSWQKENTKGPSTLQTLSSSMG